MAFVKLDTGILDSTLWMERDCREMFITALLMAEPREFTEPQKQIEMDSLDYTGFEVPPGWYGFVPAASSGIARRAMVDVAPALAALCQLGSPEAESRSREFEGRRMIRVNGGFLVLNFMRYRERDHTAAERQKRLRDRRKAASNGVESQGHAATSRNVALPSQIADADADAEADADVKSILRSPKNGSRRKAPLSPKKSSRTPAATGLHRHRCPPGV